jgi:hypothetical protein
MRHLCWVPHGLTAPQNAERVICLEGLSHQLLSIKRHGWQFILTLDESWFDFTKSIALPHRALPCCWIDARDRIAKSRHDETHGRQTIPIRASPLLSLSYFHSECDWVEVYTHLNHERDFPKHLSQ